MPILALPPENCAILVTSGAPSEPRFLPLQMWLMAAVSQCVRKESMSPAQSGLSATRREEPLSVATNQSKEGPCRRAWQCAVKG